MTYPKSVQALPVPERIRKAGLVECFRGGAMCAYRGGDPRLFWPAANARTGAMLAGYRAWKEAQKA